jgi:hypothetical protein
VVTMASRGGDVVTMALRGGDVVTMASRGGARVVGRGDGWGDRLTLLRVRDRKVRQTPKLGRSERDCGYCRGCG